MEPTEGTLTIDRREEGDAVVFELRGEIDGQTCDDLERAAGAAANGGGHVVLDLQAVSFVDSAGLRTMVALDRRSREAGGSFTIRRPSRAIARLLELTSLDRHFDVEV